MSALSAARAEQGRRIVIEAALAAGTCHIGSSLSIVDVLAVLYADVLPAAPGGRDHRFLLSKGHAASALYATLATAGVLDPSEVVAGYCADGGSFAGHPERGVPGVEMTGGSLGHGPAIALGIALAERAAGTGRRTFCLVGDGELNEGSVWESLALAGSLRLAGLTVVIDANGLQGLGPTAEVLDLEPLRPKLEAFGWETREVPGHDHEALAAALGDPAAGPCAVIARTTKGYGISFMEDELMWHYRSLREADRERVLAELDARAIA
ncbi:MAG TPA: transketolase [Baekduia sp.]|uniref:transketolase n=1 Tax=Baekduia sp. TaxID=2600305 RepID=UPI002CB58197|nr:transketolase [Baekduia sp.]HMJ33093.1 transketolase [Baekduia sp.]